MGKYYSQGFSRILKIMLNILLKISDIFKLFSFQSEELFLKYFQCFVQPKNVIPEILLVFTHSAVRLGTEEGSLASFRQSADCRCRGMGTWMASSLTVG